MAATSSVPRAGLLDLPDELLLHVLDSIDGFAEPLRATSLRAISLANRRLHRLSSPHLYSTFSFYAGVPYLFLRTICQNQDLARHVRTIKWDYDTTEAELFNYRPRVLAVKQKFKLDGIEDQLSDMAAQGNELAKQVLEELELETGPLYLGDQVALRMLLMFTTNVQHLDVVETWLWDDHRYWFMPINHSPVLSRLTSANIRGPMRFQNVAVFLTLPTLRRLELAEVVGMRQEPGRTFDWECPDSDLSWTTILSRTRSNIEHLSLHKSYVEFDDLEAVVCAMKGLKSFVYEHTQHDLAKHYIVFDVEAMIRLVKSQSHSVERLRIMDSYTRRHSSSIIYQILPSLAKLVELELALEFHTSWFRTPEWHDLPAGLVSLTLDSLNAREWQKWKDFVDLEQNLEALALCKGRGELPNLRLLTLTGWHPWYGCVPENVTCIKSMLQDVGIEFHTHPAAIGSSIFTDEDIGWVELQSEPDWVLVEKYILSMNYEVATAQRD